EYRSLHDLGAERPAVERGLRDRRLRAARLHPVRTGPGAGREVALDERPHVAPVLGERVAVEREPGRPDDARRILRGGVHVRPRDPLWMGARRIGRIPLGIDDPTHALPIPQLAGIAIDLIDLPRPDRA